MLANIVFQNNRFFNYFEKNIEDNWGESETWSTFCPEKYKDLQKNQTLKMKNNCFFFPTVL